MPRAKGSLLPAAQRTRVRVAAAAPGLTRRQLEYWVEKGYVHSAEPPARGRPRTFSDAELRVLAAMVRLTTAGLTASLAARVARAAVDGAGSAAAWSVEIADGVHVVLADI